MGMSNTGTDVRVLEAMYKMLCADLKPKTLYISENLFRYLLCDLGADKLYLDSNASPEDQECFGMTVVLVKKDDYIGLGV